MVIEYIFMVEYQRLRLYMYLSLFKLGIQYTFTSKYLLRTFVRETLHQNNIFSSLYYNAQYAMNYFRFWLIQISVDLISQII